MSEDNTPKDKVTTFSSIAGGKKEKSPGKKTDKNARHQIYVTDTQFKKAMDLIREDMNNALQLGNLANTQHYFLVKFLAQKGLLDEEEFSHFIQKELLALNNKKGNNQ